MRRAKREDGRRKHFVIDENMMSSKHKVNRFARSKSPALTRMEVSMKRGKARLATFKQKIREKKPGNDV
jgi:hypothetical protein